MSRNLALTACSVALALLLAPDEARADEINIIVRVDNVIADGGAVRVALYDEASWLGAPTVGRQAAADGESVTIAIPAPRAGRYGVAAYQDRNGDGRLNTNIIGMPSEPYGISNNAGGFGPPRFVDAAIDVAVPASTVITLR
jgi:uncharacterized protein (DUF2141 family)